MKKSMLIVFGGLPGVEKTTLAKAVARKMDAVPGRPSYIWLEADTLIRKLTKDKKSLNDLCALFERQRGNRSLDFSNRAHAGKLSAMWIGVNQAKRI